MHNREDEYQRLLRHLGHWSWMFLLYKYDSTHVLIADRPFLDKVHAARETQLQCKTAEPHDYKDVITDDTRKVLVFCEAGELAIVRQLQVQYPEKLISSGTYGYACVGRDRYSRLHEFKPPVVNQKIKPVVILSTPYADAEFVAKVMAENGMPYAHEYLARPFAAWLGLHKGFQVSRFYNIVEKRYAKEGRLSYLLQTDVLNSLFDNTHYSLGRFLTYLERTDAKVILVTRKNRMAQAITGQILERTAERSIWTKKASKKIPAKFLKGDFLDCNRRHARILEDETLLDAVDAAPISTMRVCLDDFVKHQQEQIRSIVSFLDYQLVDDGEVVSINYTEGYEAAPTLYPLISAFRQEFIDRLGVHAALRV